MELQKQMCHFILKLGEYLENVLAYIQSRNVIFFAISNVILIEINDLGFVDIQLTFYKMQAQERICLYLLQQLE